MRREYIGGIWHESGFKHEDNRGYLISGDISGNWVSRNFVYNFRAGTVRGLHYQSGIYGQSKLISVVGRTFHRMVDLVSGVSVEVEMGMGDLLYVPVGFAHGYQTLEDNVSIIYLVDRGYEAGSCCGISYKKYNWPLEVTVVSLADEGWE